MIDTLLHDLKRGSGQNAAAIPGIDIVPCTHVKLYPGARFGSMLGRIEFQPFRQWTTLYFTDQTKEFSEKATDTVHGRKFAFQVGGFYPGDNDDLRVFLGISEWVKFIVRVRDAHGVVRIIGNKTNGLGIEFESGISPEMNGKRGTVFTFSGELPDASALEY